VLTKSSPVALKPKNDKLMQNELYTNEGNKGLVLEEKRKILPFDTKRKDHPILSEEDTHCYSGLLEQWIETTS